MLALQGNFFVYDKNKNIITKLKPENRFYPITNNFTTEASIHTNLLRDLYIVLGEGNLNDGWVVRIYYNPSCNLDLDWCSNYIFWWNCLNE